MGVRSRTSGSTTVYWVEADDGDAPRNSRPDTTAYKTYSAKDDPRRYCDKCSACIVWHCEGITARHHFIHLNEFDYFNSPDEEYERGLLPDSNYFKHSNRDSGV
jgi:hypothetical protein